MNKETKLMNDIREAVSKKYDITLWRNNTGVDTTKGVRYGLGQGGADLVGVLGPDGRMVALEVKTFNGKLSHAQSCWLESVRKKGGIAAVVRSVEDAFRVLDEATCRF